MIAPTRNKTVKASNRKASRKGVVWIAVGVVLTALLVAWLAYRPGNDATGPEPVQEKKVRKPSKVSTVAPLEVKPVATNAVEAAKRYENGVEVVSSTITTNANGITVERLVLADGKTKKKVRHPKPIFEFSSDDLIATAISVKPGQSMPPLPIDRNIDQEFAKSLLSPIRINDDDTDEMKEIKAKVMETRAYLAEEIKRGGSVYQALMDHQEEVNSISDTRLMALQTMQKVREEMGDDAAEEFKERVDESFRIRGIPEIGKKSTE